MRGMMLARRGTSRRHATSFTPAAVRGTPANNNFRSGAVSSTTFTGVTKSIGDILCVAVNLYNNTASVSSVAGGDVTWGTKKGGTSLAGLVSGGGALELWYGVVTAATSTTVTVTFAGSYTGDAWLIVVQGASASLPSVVTATGNATAISVNASGVGGVGVVIGGFHDDVSSGRPASPWIAAPSDFYDGMSYAAISSSPLAATYTQASAGGAALACVSFPHA